MMKFGANNLARYKDLPFGVVFNLKTTNMTHMNQVSKFSVCKNSSHSCGCEDINRFGVFIPAAFVQ